MRRPLVLLFLLLASISAYGDRGTFDARIMELTEKGGDEYRLRLLQLSQPYGYKHKKDMELIIHLRFRCPYYECKDAATQPTLAEYHQALELLKQQLNAGETIQFGIVDRGYAQIEGTKNEYESNALEIHDGIVYSDYDFFEF